jgi:hypothetical protein
MKIIDLLSSLNVDTYVKEHALEEVIQDKYSSGGEKSLFDGVDPSNKVPFPADFGDLTRLHFLVRERKVINILEFGVGKSTAIFNDALNKNFDEHNDYVSRNLRKTDPFKCFTVDNSDHWISHVKHEYKLNRAILNYSKVIMGQFNGRICTYYENLPNVNPDLIYLDGPDQHNATGDIRGFHTREIERLPMAADLLAMEHFLLPGTLIIVDGRTANARFLRANFQRNWEYSYSADFDQHFFELIEPPLGPYNSKQVEFCLGNEWSKENQIKSAYTSK